MATRIYRPDAGRSWREANANSSNAEVSHILARYSTDLNNKRLKRGMTRAEQDVKFADQRAQAWAKTYTRVSGQVQGQGEVLQTQAGKVGEKATELDRIAKRINVLTAAIEAKSKAGTLTQAELNAYYAEVNPMRERHDTLDPVYKAQRKQWNQSNAAYQRQARELTGLEQRYKRANRRTQAAVDRYKRSVKAYNAGYYPVG